MKTAGSRRRGSRRVPSPPEFEEPRRARVSHVLARVPEAGGSEAEDKARAKVADVIRRAKAGGDFAKLAKDNSEDPGSAPSGGDLGWVRRGEMMPQFERALFALKKGEISPEPVRTPFGFHAIKVLDVREAGKKPLKDVAAQIRARLEAEAAEKVMTARAEEIRPKLLPARDFTGQAEKLPGDAMLAALQGPLGFVTAPVGTQQGYYVLKVLERVPPDLGALAAERDKVTKEVLTQKQGQAWESWVNAARVNAKVEVHYKPTSRRG